jgi:hypothetical protein
VSGQWDTVKEHLRTIKRVSEIVFVDDLRRLARSTCALLSINGSRVGPDGRRDALRLCR